MRADDDEGPESEIKALFKALAPGLHWHANKLLRGDKHGAEELVQEAFMAAWTRWAELRVYEPEHLRRWLYQVVRNKAATITRNSAKVKVGLNDEFFAHLGCDLHDEALNAVVLERCWRLIADMPEWGAVAYLRWRLEWTVAEIAEELGCSQSAVRGKLKRARDQLKQAIGPEVTFLFDSQLDDGEEARA